jgi:hypothetical protein
MKGTFFSKPLEWNIETVGEAWQQGEIMKGVLRVKNHGLEKANLAQAGVALAHAEIKKVHSRTEGALKLEKTFSFTESQLAAGAEAQLDFTFSIDSNSPVTDKKASYYLCFGKSFNEAQLQVKIEPKMLFVKIVGLLDTFYRFKQKEFKAVKKGVEFKLLPPTSRDMANIESLLLTFSMQEEMLNLKFDFQVKRLDTTHPTTKINKESVTIDKQLAPKEYSLGRDLINQDQLLKAVDEILSEVKMKAVF